MNNFNKIVNHKNVIRNNKFNLDNFNAFLELRASIPYGINIAHMNWLLVFIIVVIINIFLGLAVYIILDKFIHLFLVFRPIDKLYQKYVEKTQHKIQKYVDKYGEIGVALFIAIPLPGSGVYSGALGSYIIGLGFKKFIISCIIGVLIAGTVVTIISLAGGNAYTYLTTLFTINM